MLIVNPIELNIRYTVTMDANALTGWFHEDEVLKWFPITKICGFWR